MSPLAQLQRDFLAEVFGTDEPSRPGLAIYRRNALANLRQALASTYPVVRRLVGDAFFGEAAERFARAQPSASGDLNLYGGEFAAFLAAYPFARELPYLADVARLEWACHESFHAADAAPLDARTLTTVPPHLQGDIRFRLHPAVRLVASPYPVMSLWDANQPECDGTPRAVSGAEHVLVRRVGWAVRPGRIAPGAYLFVERIACGASLEEALDAASGHGTDFLAPLLARLAADGVLAGFTVPEEGA